MRQANPTAHGEFGSAWVQVESFVIFVRMCQLAPQDVLEAAFFLLAVRSLGKCRTGDGTCRDLMSRCQIGPWPHNYCLATAQGCDKAAAERGSEAGRGIVVTSWLLGDQPSAGHVGMFMFLLMVVAGCCPPPFHRHFSWNNQRALSP